MDYLQYKREKSKAEFKQRLKNKLNLQSTQENEDLIDMTLRIDINFGDEMTFKVRDVYGEEGFKISKSRFYLDEISPYIVETYDPLIFEKYLVEGETKSIQHPKKSEIILGSQKVVPLIGDPDIGQYCTKHNISKGFREEIINFGVESYKCDPNFHVNDFYLVLSGLYNYKQDFYNSSAWKAGYVWTLVFYNTDKSLDI